MLDMTTVHKTKQNAVVRDQNMTGKGYVRTVPIEVKGMAYRFSWRWRYSVLQAWLRFNQPDGDSPDSWVELADVPRNWLKDFLRQFWFCLPAL